jgi:CubicO group peptidase (beta-lactamase class C family)
MATAAPKYPGRSMPTCAARNENVMSRENRFSLLLICGSLLLAPLPAVSQSGPQPTTEAQRAAERRAHEIAEVFTANDRRRWEQYVHDNFGPDMQKAPEEFLRRLWDQTRGLTVERLQDVAPHAVTVLVRNAFGGWMTESVSVEPDPPYRVAGLRFWGASAPNPPARDLTTQDIAREFGAFMKRLADADLFSGAVLLAKGGKPVFQGAYGLANKDFGAPNRIDTKFNLGSMNKMFTAVSIVQLVEGGKLSFDDPLAKFLPDFPDKAAAQKIRIKHLLTHTAGLGPLFTDSNQDSWRARYFGVDDWMKLAAKDEKLLFEPGTQWQYSNTGFLVLGKVIEVVTGESYYDYVRANIYMPAHMESSDCFSLDKVNPNLAVGYDKEYTEQGIRFRNNLFEHVMRGGPHGGCYSTVTDLLKFDRALRSGKLVSAQHVSLMLSPKPELGSPEYGYGFQVDSARGIAGHSGGFIGINSNLDMFLGSDWSGIVLSNYTDASVPVKERMRELVEAAR